MNQAMMNPKKLALAKITSEMVGKPYKLGGYSPDVGFDCLGIIIYLAERWGIKIPDVIFGMTKYSYATAWASYPEWTKKKFIQFVSTLGDEIAPNKMFVPDLVLFRAHTTTHVGVMCGRGLLSAFPNLGVAIIPIADVEIKRVFRWVEITK